MAFIATMQMVKGICIKNRIWIFFTIGYNAKVVKVTIDFLPLLSYFVEVLSKNSHISFNQTGVCPGCQNVLRYKKNKKHFCTSTSKQQSEISKIWELLIQRDKLFLYTYKSVSFTRTGKKSFCCKFCLTKFSVMTVRRSWHKTETQ